MALQSEEISPIMAMVYRYLVQEVDGGPPEFKINELPFELDA